MQTNGPPHFVEIQLANRMRSHAKHALQWLEGPGGECVGLEWQRMQRSQGYQRGRWRKVDRMRCPRVGHACLEKGRRVFAMLVFVSKNDWDYIFANCSVPNMAEMVLDDFEPLFLARVC